MCLGLNRGTEADAEAFIDASVADLSYRRRGSAQLLQVQESCRSARHSMAQSQGKQVRRGCLLSPVRGLAAALQRHRDQQRHN